MDFFQNIRIATIPAPLKAMLIVAVLCMLSVACSLIYYGLTKNDYGTWTASGGYLLGVILPTTIVLLVLQFSHTGIKALRDRSTDVLTRLVPKQLKFLPDLGLGPFVPAGNAGAAENRPLAQISLRHLRGECWADYQIICPVMCGAQSNQKRLVIRLELNVNCINLDIMIPPPSAESSSPTKRLVAARDEIACVGDNVVAKHFPHTFAGAIRAGYILNDGVIERRIEERDYVCAVLTRKLGDEFLWNPSEQLFFAQDLMLMLRSLLSENPAVLETVGIGPKE